MQTKMENKQVEDRRSVEVEELEAGTGTGTGSTLVFP